MKSKLFKILLISGFILPVINISSGELGAGTVDLEISSPTESFVPLETALDMKPGDSVNRELSF